MGKFKPYVSTIGDKPVWVESRTQQRALYRAYGMRPLERGDSIGRPGDKITVETNGTNLNQGAIRSVKRLLANRIVSADKAIRHAESQRERNEKIYMEQKAEMDAIRSQNKAAWKHKYEEMRQVMRERHGINI